MRPKAGTAFTGPLEAPVAERVWGAPGPGAQGRRSRVGAGVRFACKSQQKLFGHLVLVGKAESLWRLSSQHGEMFSCTGVPRS